MINGAVTGAIGAAFPAIKWFGEGLIDVGSGVLTRGMYALLNSDLSADEKLAYVFDLKQMGVDFITGVAMHFAFKGVSAVRAKLLWNRSGNGSIDDVYDGVKQASEYLKQQGVPRQYRKQILESFDVRTIKLKTAGENTYGLRFYGGNASAEGRYLFETFSPLTNRANLALPYEWNSMTGIQQFQVKSGTTMITGAAAPQSSFGGQYIGGANQWYINNLEDLIKCQ